MEIKKKEIDSQNFQLAVSVAVEDYAEKRRKMLNDQRRKAELKGFRKGMAPMSLIERLYGPSVLADVVNGVVSEGLHNYITENALNIIGEPLPAEEQPKNDWDALGGFEFVFDVGVYPEISFELGSDDRIPFYSIEVSEKAVSEMKENVLKQFGHFKEGEEQKIENFVPAEPNQETFDRIFGADKVHTDEEFTEKVNERLVAEYANEANYRFRRDAREYLMNKADVEFPVVFLKRWLVTANEGKYSAEEVDKEFDGFLEDFKWHCVRDYIRHKFDVKVEKEDLLAEARSFAAYQFAMYGMQNVPQENLDQYAQSLLSNERDGSRIADAVEDRKTFEIVKEKVGLEHRSVSLDEFRELNAPKDAEEAKGGAKKSKGAKKKGDKAAGDKAKE